MKKNICITLLIFIYTSFSYAQPAFHRIWGVKENRKADNGWLYSLSIKDDVVYFRDGESPNKVFAMQLPEATTQTFIEIGSTETTNIIDKHQSTDGSWFIIGNTTETENFTTSGAYRTDFDYEQNSTPVPKNGFLAKYSAEGELQWCTYTDLILGDTDYGVCITTDEQSNVYFVSYKSNDEVIENAPFQSTANPEDFIPGTNKTSTLTKLDSNGTYQWSTFFGMHFTGIRNLEASTDGIIMAGILISTELFSGVPVTNYSYFSTEGAYQMAPNTNVNGEFLTSGFVNKFNFDGTRAWGTYFNRTLRTIEVFENDIYVIQVYGSSSLENEATEGVFIDEPVIMNGNVGLLSRLSSDGSELLWRTYLFNDVFKSGTHLDHRRIASINSDGNIWLFGQTNSTASVATEDAYQTEKNMVIVNNNDSYHLLLANDGSTVLYASYFGLEGDDASLAIFPAESGYYSVEQTSGNSNAENFITQGALLEPDEEGSSTYGGLVYTYFSTEPVSSGTFDKKKISIYPNPVENVLHLTGEIEDFTKIDIYNMQGQRVFQQPINASEIISVDIASIASGVYLLTISNQNNKQTYRVVKK